MKPECLIVGPVDAGGNADPSPNVHQLKTWPQYFGPMWDGIKPFDIRWDDRGYQRGDVLILREWNPDVKCSCRQTSMEHLEACTRYTGRELQARVGFVTATTPGRGSQRGFNGQGHVVLGLIGVWRQLHGATP